MMEDHELRRLVGESRAGGWGASAAAILPDGAPVFIKRLPLTALEHERPHSTRNHFRLPAFYQYGVGSAGFGAWRELAAHVKTTGWVLDGSCPAFPTLLHHRVMPRRVRHTERDPVSWVDGPDYARYWNDSKRIAAFMEARRTSPFELWLVLEHVPHRMFEWVGDHQAETSAVVDSLVDTIRFLHGHGVFHFDAHYGNVVTDGTLPLLTDFGLASDRAFGLSDREREFLDRHAHYDFGEAIYSVGNALLGRLFPLPEAERDDVLARLRPERPGDPDSVVDALVTNASALASDGVLGLSAELAEVVDRYRPVILFMSSFFAAMRANRRKNTPFDDAQLARLLSDAGVSCGPP